MKNAIIIILCIALVAAVCAGFAACGRNKNQGEPVTNYDEPAIVGGWQRAESVEITKDFQKVFDKAVRGVKDAKYTPVAYLASQVVAGTNHCVLCKETPKGKNAVTRYAILYIYENLQGNAKVSNIAGSTVSVPSYDKPVSGGWGETASPVVTDEVRAALEKACLPLDVNPFTPIAYLQTQVVAGFNYLVLCENPNVADDEIPYQLVTVYSRLDGGAEITNVSEFNVE